MIKKDNLAPIILFVYNRPMHTKHTIEALRNNTLAKDSELFIFSDAPKHDGVAHDVAAVRELIRRVDGFKKVTLVEREKKWGLANSIVDGVTTIVTKYGKVIVVEDDMVTSKNFLEYMNDSLDKYANSKNVFSVSGFTYEDSDDIDSTYFVCTVSAWGWATWADKWACFSRDEAMLEQIIEDKTLWDDFNLDGVYDWVELCRLQLEGKIDSWAIYWYATIFLNKGLTLFPAKKLSSNMGRDGSGTHCGNTDNDDEPICFDYVLTDDLYEKPYIRSMVGRQVKKFIGK